MWPQPVRPRCDPEPWSVNHDDRWKAPEDGIYHHRTLSNHEVTFPLDCILFKNPHQFSILPQMLFVSPLYTYFTTNYSRKHAVFYFKPKKKILEIIML